MKQPGVYRNNRDFRPSADFLLSESALIEVLDGRPILCVDVLFVNKKNKQLLLPKRRIQPAEGLWFVGGMIRRNTPPLEAAKKVVEREAQTAIDASKLQFVSASWFEWDYRKDPPQANGRVDFNLCYAYEPNQQELVTINTSLTPEEYDTAHGLKAYNRQQLAEAVKSESPCKQVLLDYYDELFTS